MHSDKRREHAEELKLKCTNIHLNLTHISIKLYLIIKLIDTITKKYFTLTTHCTSPFLLKTQNIKHKIPFFCHFF